MSRRDNAISSLTVVDAITKIGGPSAEQLRRPLQESVGQIAHEYKQQMEESVRKFKVEVSK